MLKTIGSTGSAANSKDIKSKVSSNSVVDNRIIDGGEAINQANSTKRKKQAKTTKSKIMVKSKNHDFSPNSKNKKAEIGFFTPETRLAFTQLRQAFVKAPILYYFDPESHIRIEIDILSYAIRAVLS